MEHFSNVLLKLADVRIRTQLPDISLSLKMLRDITKLRIETDKALQVDSTLENSTHEASTTQP